MIYEMKITPKPLNDDGVASFVTLLRFCFLDLAAVGQFVALSVLSWNWSFTGSIRTFLFWAEFKRWDPWRRFVKC
jgi:hypothetical protein